MHFHKSVPLVAIECILLSVTCAFASPSGFNLQSGDAQAPVEKNGALVVESSSNSMIDWESFSIGLDEKVIFQQFNENHYVLNRVTGGSESTLLGTLQSNGSVYLINPHGIVIGQDALIETAGFIAATLDLVGEDLSQLMFSGDSDQSVVNRGVISSKGGDVFLIARTVENSGTVITPDGRQGFLSGCDVLIRPEGAPQVMIRTEEPIDLGLLEENPYAMAIRHTGWSEGREVYLIADEGICEFSGEISAQAQDVGGEVQLLGDEVVLVGDALIDASGDKGGGVVLIGGDYQGKNPQVRNAKHVWASQDSLVKADALESGDGGKVVFWSDEATLHYGKISIRGGNHGGNGGMAEVSGKLLEYRGLTDGTAPYGNAGSLLLDPNDIEIGALATTGTFSACVPPVTYNITAGTATNQILNTDLQTQLDSCSVTISTVGSAGAGPNGGSISVSSAVSWSAANTLTLTAESFISITAAITNTSASTGFSAMSFTANGVGATTNPGILLGASGVLTTTGGNVTLSGTSSATTTASHGISLNTGSIVTTSGNISATGVVPLGSTSANIYGLYMHTANGMTSTSGTITVSGTTSGSGASGHGLFFDVGWTPATTGTFTFSNCVAGSGTTSHGVNLNGAFAGSGPVVFTTCQGSSGGGHGILFNSTFSTPDNVIATNSIVGNGVNGIGCLINNNVSVSGTNHSVAITASSTGTSGSAHGISINGTVSSTGEGGGNIGIILIGAAGASSAGFANGIHITGSGLVSTSAGDMYLSGSAQGGVAMVSFASVGVRLGNPGLTSVSSTSGNIFISGNSTALGTNSHGVIILQAQSADTTGTMTLGSAIPGGVTGCIGGAGSASDGVNMTAGISFAGNFVATNSIQGGTGSGSVGFNCASGGSVSVSGSASSIQITASSQATEGAAHGISCSGSGFTTVNGSITLNGTGGVSTTAAAHGINMTAGSASSSGSGTISFTGSASGSQSSYGINKTIANGVTSATGPVTMNGTTTATGNDSYGINVGAAWNAGTTATFSLTGSGGAAPGTASHGIKVASALSNTGVLSLSGTAGGGTGSFGNSLGANLTTSGGAITVAGSTILAANTTVDATNGGGTAAGASINFSGSSTTIDGTAAYTQTLTLLAGTSGAVTFGGVIGATTALGALTVTNAKTTASAVNIGGNITSTSFTITTASPATLTNTSIINASVTAGGSISFGGTIDGTVAGVQSLTLSANATGTVTLNGNVGATTRLGIFTTSSGASALNVGTSVTQIVANSVTVGGTVPTVLNNSALLTVDTTNSIGGSISFGGTINGTVAGSQALTLSANGTGSATLSGSVGASTRLGAFSIGSGSGALSIGTAVTSIAANSFSVLGTVPTTLNNTGTLSVNTSGFGGNIAFGGSINGASSESQNLTLNSGAGSITLTGAVGNSTSLGAIVFTNAADVTVSSTMSAATLTQSAGTGTTIFNGSLTMSSNISLTGTLFTFNAPILAANNVTIDNSGLLTISSSGDISISGAFLQSGAGLVSTAGNITTTNADIEFDGGVTLTDNVTLDTGGSPGDITFLSTIDGGFALVLNARDITFGAAVGGGTPLVSIQSTASGVINIGANQSVSTGPMTYTGAVVLTGNSQFTNSGGTGIVFSSTISGNYNLTLIASSSSIAVSGDIDLSGSLGSAGGNLTATSLSTASYGAQILVKGGANLAGAGGAGGNVSITSTGGSVSVHNINASGGNGTVSGGSGGNITLQPTNTYTGNYPDGLIVLNADLAASGNLVSSAGTGGGGSGGIITLSANRILPAMVATITSSLAGNDISISGDQIVMGADEAMTGLGNISLTASTLTLGDIIALNSLTIMGSTINLLVHGDQTLLASTGILYTSPSLHFLSGGTYLQVGSLNPAGGELDARSLSLSSAVFQPELLFESHILNFDSYPPIIPFVASAASKQYVIYLLLVADAQLSDMLPVYPLNFSYPYLIEEMNLNPPSPLNFPDLYERKKF